MIRYASRSSTPSAMLVSTAGAATMAVPEVSAPSDAACVMDNCGVAAASVTG
ncbi:hypothetical protein [Actinoplanes sp. N902-109]|uniref:hypothetical protein n=1 Tax=Actinoplanes sp. (strain N902-109) TaxID=649831 RepID=UPI0012F93AC5|nr:hypothetical protein [Actinoplanes sp. N902-109]